MPEEAPVTIVTGRSVEENRMPDCIRGSVLLEQPPEQARPGRLLAFAQGREGFLVLRLPLEHLLVHLPRAALEPSLVVDAGQLEKALRGARVELDRVQEILLGL